MFWRPAVPVNYGKRRWETVTRGKGCFGTSSVSPVPQHRCAPADTAFQIM